MRWYVSYACFGLSDSVQNVRHLKSGTRWLRMKGLSSRFSPGNTRTTITEQTQLLMELANRKFSTKCQANVLLLVISACSSSQQCYLLSGNLWKCFFFLFLFGRNNLCCRNLHEFENGREVNILASHRSRLNSLKTGGFLRINTPNMHIAHTDKSTFQSLRTPTLTFRIYTQHTDGGRAKRENLKNGTYIHAGLHALVWK